MAGEINWGVIDPSLPGKIANSFYQGQQEQQRNALLAAQLKAAQNQDAMAQYQLASAQRKDQEANALRASLPEDFDASNPAHVNALLRASPEGGAALLKSLGEARYKAAETSGKLTDVTHKTLGMYRDALSNVQTPEDAAQWLTAQYSDPNTAQHMKSMAPLQQALSNIPTDPAAFAQWKNQSALGMGKYLEMNAPKTISQNLGGTERVIAIPGLGGAASVVPGSEGKVSIAPGQAAQLAQSERHFQQQQFDSKVPQGYRKTGTGNLEAIPGGPADLKIQGQFNQDTAQLNSSVSAMDRLAIAANEAMNHPGLPGTAGLRGTIPNIPGTEAADAAALLNTLKSQVAFGVLQDMRNNSKTGGALGNVSDAEGKRLEANLAALEKSQSVDQLRTNLKKIVDYTQQAKDRIAQAYNMKYKTAEATGANLQTPIKAFSSSVSAATPTVSNW